MSLEARTALYSRLVEVLGDTPAETLMSYLPGSDPATKADVQGLETSLEPRLGGLDQRMGGLEQRMVGLDQRMDGLDQRMDRLELRMDRLEQRMDRLEEKMDSLIMSFHSELRAQTRMFILASLGSSATLAVAIVSAAAIL